MYIWRVNRLVEDLKENRVTERETFKYFFVWFLFICLEVMIYELFPQPVTASMVISSISYTVLTLLGVLICYWANTNGDNRNFVSRFVCLNLPLSIRIFVYFILAGFLIFSGALLIVGKQGSQTFFENLFEGNAFEYFILLSILAYYLWVRSKIRKVSRHRPLTWASPSLQRKTVLALFLIVSFGLTGMYSKNKETWDPPITAFFADNVMSSTPPTLELNAEDIFYRQHERVQLSLKEVKQTQPGKPDMYLLSFSSDWKEKGYMVESGQVQEHFEKRFKSEGHTLRLVNHRETMDRLPLATVKNLKEALKGIAARMNIEEDILLLYITSHGSVFNEVTVEMGDLPLQSLNADVLAKLLRESGIKWKVIVINTCYSGGFFEDLEDDTTLILTSSSENQLAYFCDWEREDCRDFSKALFVDGFRYTNSFTTAFPVAASVVYSWEEKDGLEHSQPQMKSTPQIEKKLEQWMQTLDRPPTQKQKVS